MLSRRAVGTAVFAGMIAASSIGVFLIPMLYATFQGVRERAKARFQKARGRTSRVHQHIRNRYVGSIAKLRFQTLCE